MCKSCQVFPQGLSLLARGPRAAAMATSQYQRRHGVPGDLLVAWCCLFWHAIAAKPRPSAIFTSNGPVEGFERKGIATGNFRVTTFWGIPFAEPPVGELRLRAPQPLKENWTEVLQANKKSTVCIAPQPPSKKGEVSQKAQEQGEDCLYLNVYTPTDAIADVKSLPVMVWIYGGAYVFGDAYSELYGLTLYDAAMIVGRHDVVVVTMNYRLNGLGFFASDSLLAEDPRKSTGNMAMMDQRLAMQWVQDNIQKFGGDRSRVTLFGESAGAFSVVWHLVSQPSWPLFQRAIVQSGTSKLSWFFQPYEGHSREFYAEWAEAIGCPRAGATQLTCLRSLSPHALIVPPLNLTVAPPTYSPSVYGSIPFGSTIDGAPDGLTDLPLTLIREGKFNKVPLIIGSNLDDGSMFEKMITPLVPGATTPWVETARDVDLVLEWAFDQKDVPLIKAAYPEEEFTTHSAKVDYKWMLSRMIRDVGFACSTREVAKGWGAYGVPVWTYTFSFDLGPLLGDDWGYGMGTFHSVDILFTFRHLLWLEMIAGVSHTLKMANVMNCKWTTFAHTGSPEGSPDAPLPNDRCDEVQETYSAWPPFQSQEARVYYSLQVPPQVVEVRSANRWPDDELPSDARCDMWDQVAFPWRRNV